MNITNNVEKTLVITNLIIDLYSYNMLPNGLFYPSKHPKFPQAHRLTRDFGMFIQEGHDLPNKAFILIVCRPPNYAQDG